MTVLDKIQRKLRAKWLDRLSIEQLSDRLASRRGVVGLCYHSLSPDLDDYNWRTMPDAFDEHLEFLKSVFDIVPSQEAVSALEANDLAGRPKPVAVLCFDDGYRDNWTVATGLLEKHGLPATLFAARDLVLQSGDTYLSEGELQALANHPLWTLGAHGLSHNILTGFKALERDAELADCAAWMSDLLGEKPKGFAYPHGDISPDVVDATRQHYEHAFSTDRRLSNQFDRYQIRRLCPTRAEDPVPALAKALMETPFEDGRR